MGVEVGGDGDLQIGDGVESAARRGGVAMSEKKPSPALTQEAEVGVKWNVQQR